MSDLMKCIGCDQEKEMREFRRSFLGYPICMSCESKLGQVAQAVAAPPWLDSPPERTGPMTAAENGKKALIDHLRASGTGEAKLTIAARADVSKAKNSLVDGARATVEYMEQVGEKGGIGAMTIAKARIWLEELSKSAAEKPAKA